MAKYAIEHWARLPGRDRHRQRVPLPRPGARRHGPWSSGSASPVRPRTPSRPSRRPAGTGPRSWSSPTWSTRRWPARPTPSSTRGPDRRSGWPPPRPTWPRSPPSRSWPSTWPRPGGPCPRRRPGPVRGHGRPPRQGGPGPRAGRRRGGGGRPLPGLARRSSSSGARSGYPVALEGALKLKELSYLRAEGFPAGELKHGPIALVEPGTVVIGVATRTPIWEKMMSNVAEVKSRGATVVLVANDGDEETARQADAVLWVPETRYLFAPIVDVVPAADVRLLAGPAPRPRRRPTPQSGQGGHRRVSPGRPGRAAARACSERAARRPGRPERPDRRVVGVGVDAVDLERFRRVLGRRAAPGRAALHRRRAGLRPVRRRTRCPGCPPGSPPRRRP